MKRIPPSNETIGFPKQTAGRLFSSSAFGPAKSAASGAASRAGLTETGKSLPKRGAPPVASAVSPSTPAAQAAAEPAAVVGGRMAWLQSAAFSPQTLLAYLLLSADTRLPRSKAGGGTAQAAANGGRPLSEQALSALQAQWEREAAASPSRSFSSFASAADRMSGALQRLLQGGASVALAENNLLFSNEALLHFLPFVFGGNRFPSDDGHKWLYLFNHSCGREGFYWRLFPFDIGTVTAGFLESRCLYCNINWLHREHPHSVHIQVAAASFSLAGSLFTADPHGKWARAVEAVLLPLGYRKQEPALPEGAFDGFRVYSPPERVCIRG